MEDLIDLIATDGSAADVTTNIKDLMYMRAAAKVDEFRPVVADVLFNGQPETEAE